MIFVVFFSSSTIFLGVCVARSGAIIIADRMHYSSHFWIRDSVIQSYGYRPYIQVKCFSNKFGNLFKASCQYGSVPAYRHCWDAAQLRLEIC